MDDHVLMEGQALQHIFDLVGGEEQLFGLSPLEGDDIERRVWRLMRSGRSNLFNLTNLLNSFQQLYTAAPSDKNDNKYIRGEDVEPK